MKRILLCLAASSLIFSGLQAQTPAGADEHKMPSPLMKDDGLAKKAGQVATPESGSAIILSENFASGIPANWTNAGFDVDAATGFLTPNPLCVWEYRGPSTTPSNATGSRGAFASGAPIASPSAGNGFIIFDSDYLDNGGNSGNIGGGVSAAPHIGTLTTDTIDCSAYPYIEVSMYSFLRHFSSRYLVAVSNDGGVTWADTVRFEAGVAVNSSSVNGVRLSADISAVAGGESDVMLSFIYDGAWQDPGAAAIGYYFWCIDDIVVQEVPPHEVKFVEFNGAPPHDVIYPTNHPKYGNPQEQQAAVLPVTFDSNIYNYGWRDQTNVTLKVDIFDASNTLVTSLSSPTLPLLASKDTGSFNDFTTSTAWTPTLGDYTAVFYVESDSISSVSGSVTPYDSIPFSINSDIHAAHFGSLDNTIGIAQNMIALAQAFTFPADVDSAGYVFVDWISVYISSVSDTTGTLIVEVYDTAGFSYGAGGGPAGNPIRVKSFSLNANNIGQTSAIDMTTNGMPMALNSNGGYFVVFNLVSGAGDIRLGNDQTVETPTSSANPLIAMQRNDGTWFSGFLGSRSLSNLIINLHTMRSPFNFSLEEILEAQNAIKMYPNPSSTGVVTLEMGLGGSYELEVVSINGQRVHSEVITVNGGEKLTRDFSGLEKGVYLLNFNSDELNTTRRLIIE